MSQRNKSFKIYVHQMDEVAGHEPNPSWFERIFRGAQRKRESKEEMFFRLSNSLARYLNFPIDHDSIRRGIAGNYGSLPAGQQAFMVIARSIFNSITNGPVVGINRGQIQQFLNTLGPQTGRHLGDESNGPNVVEAMTLFLGQMAQQAGGHINLEPQFQRDVETYYQERHVEGKKDRKKGNEVRRGGLEYLGGQIARMGLEDATIQDLEQAFGWALQRAAARGTATGDADVVQLRQLLRGMGGTGTP